MSALDEVCSGRHGRCNGSAVESCCGWALCADCYREHREESCDALTDEVRRELYPEGCDHTLRLGAVCFSCARRVEAEVRMRAAREVTP